MRQVNVTTAEDELVAAIAEARYAWSGRLEKIKESSTSSLR